ncbi:MAG TPA: response regulator transcription factor [Saprospiraceae bacterium]|nr:response regulator transcription factor [Saprospiraceae bacterium]
MELIRIVIYDDHLQRCESLRALLLRADGMECVGSFHDCSHVIEDMHRLQPDVILMDIEMPVADGISGVRIIKKEFPHIRIIMQTVFEDEARIFASLQAGAEGYILKNASAEKIIESIREVHGGGASMTPSVALRVMKYFNQVKTVPDYSLTAKEKEVLALLADGNSYKMVAAKLNISYFTVNTHIKNIYEKLHVHSLGEAVSFALKNKIV